MAGSIHVENRELILRNLREELVGPSPQGEEIDCSGPIVFSEPSQAYRPYRQKWTGEEIIMRDPPSKRYGVGVLNPRLTDPEVIPEKDNEEPLLPGEETGEAEVVSQQALKDIEEIEQRSIGGRRDETDPDDFDLSSANLSTPSSMGVSFLAELPPGSRLVVEVPEIDPAWEWKVNGRYRGKEIVVGNQKRSWYLREPVFMRAEYTVNDLCGKSGRASQVAYEERNTDGLELAIEVFSRPREQPDQRLLTVCLVNRTKASTRGKHEGSLFQAYFRARVEAPDQDPHILPYPSGERELDEEEESLALLYRRSETFAVGHGCAADWETTEEEKVWWVSAECMPTYETPNMTPDVTREDGTTLQVSMAALAGLIPGNDGFASLEEVVALYEEWISDQRKRAPLLPERYHKAAERHIQQCDQAARRMREGLEYLRANDRARCAFRLANHAILSQQMRGRPEARKAIWDDATRRIVFAESPPEPDPAKPQGGRGFWRAFQIAFLLMTLRSVADGHAPDRQTVELIWFPTGGGKTEAYFGLAAFTIFMRRLIDPTDAGVHVLMRYTLRLLTAQQFQRAAGLICAMEYLRREAAGDLGKEPFSIGIWLGGDTTPNRRKDALEALRRLEKDPDSENPFILPRCPWCNAQLGPLKSGQKQRSGRGKASQVPVIGYEQTANTVVFKCKDSQCEFRYGLPVYVVDEDIYERRPTLVIGTVDKFASLAWRPEARSLFGLGKDGERVTSPPGLIIQDELHLISGPLGSMVGLYETVIEELCTDRRVIPAISPKIVCSTATIRRYEQQIRALYARTKVCLFPSPGLDAADSFFARYATDEKEKRARGRMYVGVHAPGLGSMQTTQVRTFTSLLQAPVPLSPEGRDPWWTLLIFFNSLRELGTSLTLLQSDIPDYMRVLRYRTGFDLNQQRSFYNIKELTSRLRGDEVPEAIADLSVPTTSPRAYPVDVCLASNIIEVGVDIDRLSLMAIVGQPKTTSQYIQVSGRVGRRAQERPGLVVTLYGASKPRDRSHFEKFRSYHQRLYAQVEPTSVTPFSPPVLDRALHAIMVAYARQAGDWALAKEPRPYPAEVIDYLRELIMQRVQVVDPEEVPTFKKVFDKRAREWKRWNRSVWSPSGGTSEIPLLREMGSYATKVEERLSWATPLSMRNVDAECMGVITEAYILGDEQDG